MQPSELFAGCAHYRVALGQTPNVQVIDSETDHHTRDWSDAAQACPQNPALLDDARVQSLVMKFWDLFRKGEDNTISSNEHQGFVRRFARVYLPGLSEQQELTLAANTWREDAGGSSAISFAKFFIAVVRLGQMWLDSNDPAAHAAFLEDLYERSTRVSVSSFDDSGKLVQVEEPPVYLVTFRRATESDDNKPLSCPFGACLDVQSSISDGKAKLTASMHGLAKGDYFHVCWFRERVVGCATNLGPEDGVARTWAPLDEVMPIGWAANHALRTARADAGTLEIDLAGVKQRPDSLQTCLSALNMTYPMNEISVEVSSDEGQPIVMEGTDDQPFGLRELMAIALTEDIISEQVLLRPEKTSPHSVLWKLNALRIGLGLEQNDASLAAMSRGKAKAQLQLPVFTDIIAGKAAVSQDAGVVKHVKKESLLSSGSLTSLAENFITDTVLQDLKIASDAPNTGVEKGAKDIYEAFTAHFPALSNGLSNDEADILNLANTAPLNLWILGQCDNPGSYKTEVCRRLANKLGIQWLQPCHALELAVKTPAAYRTPIMKRCVEQLQRGMTVSITDALRLIMEIISSAPCKTNGYILDLPSISPEEAQDVVQFAEKLKNISGQKEIRWEEILKDTVELPPLKAEPEPPKPPAAEGEEGGEETAAAAEEAAPEAAAENVPADAPAEGEGEEPAPPPEPPVPPMVPNPLVNCLPRRVVLLSMDTDEVAGWRTAVLKLKHAEKARKRKELEDAGEEVPEEEEEEEPEELPVMPEEEEEQKELFDKTTGDVLQTMKSFLRLPSLEPPKVLPPVPDESQEVPAETVDRAAFRKGEEKAIKALQKHAHLPVLSMHLDGCPPEAAADCLEEATGKGKGLRVPLPVALEGGGDEPKELLRTNLGDRQASRRWSPWKFHCPVSLHEKSLTKGSTEFAVDYAGYVFLCADVEKQRRFCNWPKPCLTEAPRINAPGMHLGFSLLSPCGYRTKELAKCLYDTYDFDIVNVVSLLERACAQPPMLDEYPEVAEDDPDAPPPPPRPAEGEPWLNTAEHQLLLSGKTLGIDTSLRLIAWALGIQPNLQLIKEQHEKIEAAKKQLEDAQAAGTDPPADIKVDEETGTPIILLSEPLRLPAKGFVLEGFPESVEQAEALKNQLRLNITQVLLLKPGEEGPEVLELLQKQGLNEHMPLEPILETQLANFEALAGVEGLEIAQVAMEAIEEHQFVQIRKHIDPFYKVVEEASAAFDIPDPDEWEQPEVDPDAEGEDAIPQERPVIPWSSCGTYCPVTLKEHRWLYPGQKEFQHVYGNRVFALANEKASEAFLREPVRYVPSEREPVLPPPRIMVTGPTGSGVAKQCEMLSQVYKIPVLQLEKAWRAKVEDRLKACKQKVKDAAKKEALEQPMTNDDGSPGFPVGWLPVPDKPAAEEGEEEQEEEAAAPEEAEPEDDGLDDEGREAQFVLAMQDVLGAHIGACVIDGTWFGDLEDEEMAEEVRTARSLQSLLTKAQRTPDLTLILKCKNDVAAKNCLDFEAIDKAHEERVAEYKKLVAEAEAKEEDPPEAPEDLVIPDEDSEEKESDRAKAKFIEKKQAQQAALKEFEEAIKVVTRSPFISNAVQKVVSDRGPEPTHKSCRWHCRPFLEHRSSLLLRQQITKVRPNETKDLLQRGLARTSRFGSFNPLFMDAPVYPGRNEAFKLAAHLRGRIFYPQSEAELGQLLERPADFLQASEPSRVNVNPAIAITGAPLSGKTLLAQQLAKRTGAVYVSLAEVVSNMVAKSSLPTKLSKDILAFMKQGRQVPDEALIGALRQRLLAPDVLSRGWVLDDFPLTAGQAKALTQAGIVPHRLLVLNVSESIIFSRTRALVESAGGSDNGDALLQQEAALQRQRLLAYQQQSPSVRTYYSVTFDNVRDVDGSRLPWAVFDQAVEETNVGISQRLEYYRRTAVGMAAPVRGLCFSPSRLEASLSDWQMYCPVTLSVGNELEECSDARHAVEYKSKVYWLASSEKAKLFADEPEAFLQVPLPENVPKLLSCSERKDKAAKLVELEGYCPVVLVNKKDLVKSSGFHMVEFAGSLYSCASQEAAAKFLRRPVRYVKGAKLPSKKPVLPGLETQSALLSSLLKGKDGRGLHPDDMCTYMQASVAEAICQALVDSGERRPLYPGKDPQESALLYLARFLRAKNTVNTEMYAQTVKQQREDFLSDCALPSELKRVTELKKSKDYVWTASDSARFKELCDRFDKVFSLSR